MANKKRRSADDHPLLDQLKEIQSQAKADSESSMGIFRRVRLWIWTAWLWLLVRAAHARLKHVIIVLVLLFLALVFYLLNPVEDEPKFGLNHSFAIESPEFLATIAGATNAPFTSGNSIEILSNGNQFYPAMIAAIEQARVSITVEAYIYWAGEIGRRFADLLAAKARSGVSVKILLDAVGSSSISDELIEILEAGGCEVRWYRPIHWYSFNRVNNRTHRKSFIIDGRVGFTGGAGIADHWLGNAEDPDHWRDTQIRIEGPAVAALQHGFARNWLETTGELVSGEKYYPPPAQAGTLAVQSILSWPETGSSTVRVMYYLSIACARKSIYIANPYFVPDELAIQILAEAKKRGVDVKIMVAGINNDNALARNNSTRLYGRLLEAGVEIYEYNRTMLHHKFMVCDGVWSTVGTTNFDNRSFALNDENNVCVYDQAFASVWTQIFFNDMPACHLVSLDEWNNRGFGRKIKEFLSSLLRSQV